MSLLDDASIVITPNGVKAGTLYAVIPSDGTADVHCVRASATTEVDSTGLPVYVAPNVPRIELSGGCPVISSEPERENLVFPSDLAVTQTRTVAAVEHVLTFYGTGTVVLTGTHSATLAGTGDTDRVQLIFTPTAGSLILTVTGSVKYWQLEEGSYPTSLIETETGTVTRAKDQYSRDGISSLINSTEGVLFVEVKTTYDSSLSRRISLSNGSTSNRVSIEFDDTVENKIKVFITLNGASETLQYTAPDLSIFNKIAVKWKANDFAIWFNGSAVVTETAEPRVPTGMNQLSFDGGNGANFFYGEVKQLQIYKTTDIDLASLTS